MSYDQPDSWWVALGEEVQDELMSLSDIAKLKEENPNSKISILHESNTDDENAKWIPFQTTKSNKLKVVRDGDASGSKFVIRRDESGGGTAAGLSAADKAEFDKMKTELEELKSLTAVLKEEVEAMKTLADELKVPILEAKAILDERETFLEQSEASLFENAQEQEVLRAELSQMKEDLEDREARLATREQEMDGKERAAAG